MWSQPNLVVKFLFLVHINSVKASGKSQGLSSEKNYETLVGSLKHYNIFIPLQFEDYELSNKKHSLSTLLPNYVGIHVNKSYFSISYGTMEYVLDVSLNHVLIPDYFSISSYDKSGNLQIYKPKSHEINHCYYQGHVRGIENSQVVLSTCNGLRGYIALQNDTLFIEPLPNSNNLNTHKEHIIYRHDDVISHEPESHCASQHSSEHAVDVIEELKLQSESFSFQRLKRSAPSERRFVELLIVADHAEAKLHSDRIKLIERIKEIVNYVDGFYQSLKIRVVLSHVEIWNQTNLISNSTNPIKVLDEFLFFCNERKSKSGSDSPYARADNFHLLYGGEFDGATVGMANVKAMCSSRSGGVNEDGSRPASQTAATLAHEMGHNFGMSHDTPDCSCEKGTDCLMDATLGSTPRRTWSDCSQRYLQQNFDFGLGACLLNVPAPGTIFTGQQCGNDIVEGGEECDCGLPDQCQSKCCDPNTCKLVTGAKCDFGLCCRDCQFMRSGSECRAAVGECDLPEYCTGSSPHCPGNFHRLNGGSCAGKTASCYDSVCLTIDMQCKAVWGDAASVSVDRCYTEVNELGNKNGNCGKLPAGGFRKCSPANAKCGKLICQTKDRYDRPKIGSDRVSFINEVEHDGKKHLCKTISSVSSDNDVTDVGLVRTGTKCAEAKTCVEGWCNVTSETTCDDKCNERGVCNNVFNCHCDRGWAPPFCKGRGNGGSWDSGPVDSTDTDEAVVLMIVLSAVVLPIVLGLGFFIWYRYCGGKIRMGIWKKNRQKRLDAIALSKGKTPKSSKAKSNSQENLFDDINTQASSGAGVTSTTYKGNTDVSTLSSPPRRPPPPRPQNLPSGPKSFFTSVPIRTAPPPPNSSNARYKELSNPATAGSKPVPTRQVPARPPNRQQPKRPEVTDSSNAPVVSVKDRMQHFNRV